MVLVLIVINFVFVRLAPLVTALVLVHQVELVVIYQLDLMLVVLKLNFVINYELVLHFEKCVKEVFCF